jgi:ribonuclease P protein component
MIGRIVRSADFERVLRTPTRARSAHFALHHLAVEPGRSRPRPGASAADLSTGGASNSVKPVEDAPPTTQAAAPSGVWLGAVVPKRHARRSVTRSLMKREIRAAVGARDGQLLGGLWVVRLKAPFDRGSFPSAASESLQQAVRAELRGMLDAAARR